MGTNCNVNLIKPTSSSEDVSDYTDADESISAPTEFLAEFLSAVMLKDYETALKYCKLILQYEPNNSTAKEFYPLILEKLQMLNRNDDDDDDDEDDGVEDQDEDEEAGEESENEEEDEDDDEDDENDEDEAEDDDDDDEEIEISQSVQKSKTSSDGTTGSYSSLEDDDAEMDQLVALATKYNVNDGNGNQIFLEPKVDIKFNLTSKTFSSDSESPTEPITAQKIAMLRSRVVPTYN